jgi:periplasmic protein TonB
MKKTILTATIMLASIQLQAQEKEDSTKIEVKNNESTKKEIEIYSFVERMPEYPGGEDALILYLQKNVKYPKKAIKKEIEGTVNVEFIVNENGSISKAKVVKRIGSGCDEEALRVIKAMPKWIPGTQGGKNVRVYYTVPIVFRLE